VQPFERLRHLARWTDDDDVELLEDSADCLAGFAEDPFGVVIACRRLLAYHPTVAPLWWLCAHVLSAPDAHEGAWGAWRESRSDPTGSRLAGALPFPHELPVAVVGWPDVVRDGLAERIDLELLAVRSARSDPQLSRRLRVSVQSVRVIDETELLAVEPSHLLVAPLVCGDGRVLVAPGTRELMAAGRDVGAKLWLVVPRGFALPGRMVEAMERSIAQAESGDPPAVECAPADFDAVVGPEGLDGPGVLAHRADCAPAPELLRIS
jgi:hypothetical protein